MLFQDATSVDGDHISEICVSANDKHMVLDVLYIPGERATDYVTNIFNSFSGESDCYVSLCPDRWTKTDLLVHLYKKLLQPSLTGRQLIIGQDSTWRIQ